MRRCLRNGRVLLGRMCLQQSDHSVARMALGRIAFVSPRLQLSRPFSTALAPLAEEPVTQIEDDDQEPEESDIEEDKLEDQNLSPPEIVAQLDRFIIGQTDAKRAVALALRNRWRRKKLDPKMRDEVMPKNILMIGSNRRGED